MKLFKKWKIDCVCIISVFIFSILFVCTSIVVVKLMQIQAAIEYEDELYREKVELNLLKGNL